MKILPIASSPVSAYLNEPHTCNIILNDDRGYKWLYNYFVQWEWSANALVTYMPEHIYGKTSLVFTYAVPNEIFIRSGDSFVDLVVKAIDHGYYVATCLNELHLPTVHYKRDRHNVLIYGYDEGKKEIYIMTYKRGGGVYGTCKCTFSEIAQAYQTLGKYSYTDPNDTDSILFIRPNPSTECHFNVLLLKDLLNDYLVSHESKWRFDPRSGPALTPSLYCGINCYERVLEYVRDRKGRNRVDIRSFCALRDHKYVMYQRIKYLEKEAYLDKTLNISAKYNMILQKAENIRWLAMKFMRRQKSSILDTIYEEIKEIQKDEPRIIEEVIKQLELYNTLGSA